MWVQSLGWEDTLEEEMATHSSIEGRISWTEEHRGLQSVGSQRVGYNEGTEKEHETEVTAQIPT